MIFTSRYGLPVEPRNFSRSHDSRISNAGVPKITVHDTWRTCGSLLVDLDVHPRIVMALLDHDGDLQSGLIQGHARGPAEARREPRSTSCAVQVRKSHLEESRWLLTCVGTAGFEPTTP
nr:hypothetical protein [Micromonospora sp. WP24]